jgi:hypothetical protein
MADMHYHGALLNTLFEAAAKLINSVMAGQPDGVKRRVLRETERGQAELALMIGTAPTMAVLMLRFNDGRPSETIATFRTESGDAPW